MLDESILRRSSKSEVQALMLLVDEIRELKTLLQPKEVIKATEPNLVDYSTLKRNELMAEMKLKDPPNNWTRWSNQQMIDFLTNNENN